MKVNKIKNKSVPLWKDGGICPSKKVKGLLFQRHQPTEEKIYYRVTNTFTNSSTNFKDRQEAVTYYDKVAQELTGNESIVEATKEEQKAISAWRSIQGLRDAVGKSNMTLTEAIDMVQKKLKQEEGKNPLVIDTVLPYLNYMEKKGRNRQHIANTRHNLEVAMLFIGSERRMKEIEMEQAIDILNSVRGYIDKKNGKPVTENTFKKYALSLSGLWTWNVDRQQANANPFKAACEDLCSESSFSPKKEYTTPKSLNRMLNWTMYNSLEMLPALALLAFCGLRPSEVHRLRWRHITIEEGGSYVHTSDFQNKTSSSRMVTICPACIAWLNEFFKRNGKPDPNDFIIPIRQDRDDEFGEEARKCLWLKLVRNLKKHCPPEVIAPIGLPSSAWPRDLLRHSFATYHRAVSGAIDKTAEQLGNSSSICKMHYSTAVRKKEGEAYFDTFPADAA